MLGKPVEPESESDQLKKGIQKQNVSESEFLENTYYLKRFGENFQIHLQIAFRHKKSGIDTSINRGLC